MWRGGEATVAVWRGGEATVAVWRGVMRCGSL